VAPNGRVALADWGYLVTLEQSSGTTTAAGGLQGFRGSVVALDVHLNAAHGGLPAGSEIQVGYAEVEVQAGVPPPPKRETPAPKKIKKGKKPSTPEPSAGRQGPAPLLPIPTGLQPQLTAGRYVFRSTGPRPIPTPSALPARMSATPTATTSSRPWVRRCSPVQTGSSSRSAGTTSGVTDSG
jgi:hypothetical protein